MNTCTCMHTILFTYLFIILKIPFQPFHKSVYAVHENLYLNQVIFGVNKFFITDGFIAN